MIQAIQQYSVLKGVVDRCDAVVRTTLGKSPLREGQIALEGFNNGGKRLRPALLVLSSLVPRARSLGDVDDSLIDLAGAVELVHLATLFHDDVIDEVDTRRTKQSARLKYGNYVSVLTGDFALAEALELVQRSGHTQAMPEFVRALRALVRGESVETVNQYNYDLSEAQYYDIISEKSASLFALSCKVGAMLQGREYADPLGHFGWGLGMAFQMIDDLDDMLELPNGTTDCDLENGYLSLPVIRLLNHLRDGHRTELVNLIRRGDFTREDEKRIITLCTDHGGIQHTRSKIGNHLDRAAGMLKVFETNEGAEMLASILVDLESYADAQINDLAVFREAHN